MARLTQQELQDAIDALMVDNNSGDVTVALQKTLLKDQMESVSGKETKALEVYDVAQLDPYINGDAWDFNDDINIHIMDDLVFDKAFNNNGYTVHLIKSGFAGGSLTYTGTGALFRGSGPTLGITNQNIFLEGAGASLFNTSGIRAIILKELQVTFNPALGQSIGLIDKTDRAVSFELATFITYLNGLQINCSNSVGMSDVSFFSTTAGSGTTLRINKEASIINLAKMTFATGSGEAALHIDPDLEGSADLQALTNLNNFAFYEGGNQGAIQSFADAAITASAITSVSDNAGQAQFNHAGTDVFVGQEVEVTDFVTNTAYNGTAIVTATAAGSFELGIPFGSTETGTYQSDSVTVGSTAHGLTELDTLLIEDGADYYGGATIYNVQTNSFQINRTFTVNKTGTWNTGSLTEDDSRINATDIGEQADSASYGSLHFNGNAAETTIIDGTYVDIALTGLVEVDSENSRFFLNDPSNGEMIYKGRKPFKGSYKVIIASPISVNIEDYRLSYQINDTVPTFATAPFMPWNLRQAGDQCIIEYEVFLQPGDRIRPKLAGDDGDTNIAVAHGIFDIN